MRHKKAVLRIRDVYPGSRIRIFPARIQGHKGSGSRIRIKELKYFLTQKIVSKLSEILSGIPDLDLDFLQIQNPGSRVKKAPDRGSATLQKRVKILTRRAGRSFCRTKCFSRSLKFLPLGTYFYLQNMDRTASFNEYVSETLIFSSNLVPVYC
jgi:hypothetical protein